MLLRDHATTLPPPPPLGTAPPPPFPSPPPPRIALTWSTSALKLKGSLIASSASILRLRPTLRPDRPAANDEYLTFFGLLVVVVVLVLALVLVCGFLYEGV